MDRIRIQDQIPLHRFQIEARYQLLEPRHSLSGPEPHGLAHLEDLACETPHFADHRTAAVRRHGFEDLPRTVEMVPDLRPTLQVIQPVRVVRLFPRLNHRQVVVPQVQQRCLQARGIFPGICIRANRQPGPERLKHLKGLVYLVAKEDSRGLLHHGCPVRGLSVTPDQGQPPERPAKVLAWLAREAPADLAGVHNQVQFNDLTRRAGIEIV